MNRAGFRVEKKQEKESGKMVLFQCPGRRKHLASRTRTRDIAKEILFTLSFLFLSPHIMGKFLLTHAQ